MNNYIYICNIHAKYREFGPVRNSSLWNHGKELMKELWTGNPLVEKLMIEF